MLQLLTNQNSENAIYLTGNVIIMTVIHMISLPLLVLFNSL